MQIPNSTKRKVGAALVVVATLAGAAFTLCEPALAQMMGHMHGGMHGHGADGMGHDEVNMPGLRGENATPEESAELAVMFSGFQTFSHKVINLPDGIRTVTRSSDPEVMAALQIHAAEVSEMAARGMQAMHERMMQSGG